MGDPAVLRSAWWRSWWSLAVAAVVLAGVAFWMGHRTSRTVTLTRTVEAPLIGQAADEGGSPTRLWAHNVLLRKGPNFRVYVRWIRGRMLRTDRNRIPNLDLTNSFVLEIEKGVIDAKLADVAQFLNSGQQGKPPLTDMQVENHDGELQIKGTAHKGISVPVRLDGDLIPLPDGRLKFHLKKLNVLKMPVKGLFGLFHLKLDDLMPKTTTPGIEASGDDILLDTRTLLPPPHIHGIITSVQMEGDHVRVIYGGATQSDEELAQWHNFLRLSGGSVSFARLTMRDADLTLIDTAKDDWFDLDLANYQEQLIYGTMHTTPSAGVEVYMPDLDHMPPEAKNAAHAVTLDWLKDRNTEPARKDVPSSKP